LLDGLVPGVVGIIPSLILGQVFATDPFGDTLWLAVVWFSLPYVVSMIINWLYFAGFESSRWQATLGKRALGIAVTDLAGSRITFLRATARAFAHYLSLISFGIGYLIQPFTEKRQALHDLVAGTLVVTRATASGVALNPAAAMAGQHIGPQPRHGMPGWAVVLIVAPLALCVGCAYVGYFVALPRVRAFLEESEAATTDQIADTIATAVSARIDGSARSSRQLVLSEDDLDINNAQVVGEAGVERGSDWATIYGFETGITPEGITLGAGEETMYRIVPVVADGRVELTAVDEPDDYLGIVLISEKSFEQGLEEGINRALASSGLRPTAVTLQQNYLTIITEAMAQSLAPYRSGLRPI
jgi:uncharacterized RDD family membrane protein YckC